MRTRTTELWLFALALALANLPLLAGRVCEPLLFDPARVAAGEWWRALTGPLVHVSAYHLLLDAGAFLLLYRGLREPSPAGRLFAVAACAAGSALLALPQLRAAGGSLCGLSGVAHGLLAVSALELLGARDRPLARAGAACLLLVAGKSALEALTGRALFESLHLGDVATPLAVCHLGGVLGGLAAWAALAARDRLVQLALFSVIFMGAFPFGVVAAFQAGDRGPAPGRLACRVQQRHVRGREGRGRPDVLAAGSEHVRSPCCGV